jgi:hypothetical protein
MTMVRASVRLSGYKRGSKTVRAQNFSEYKACHAPTPNIIFLYIFKNDNLSDKFIPGHNITICHRPLAEQNADITVY